GNFRWQPLRADHSENAFERAPGALLGGSRKFFRSIRWSTRDGGKRLNLVKGLQSAMIKVRERKLGSGLVRGFFPGTFPVRFGSVEIQLLFVFKRAQRVQFSIRGLLLQEITQSQACLARRLAKRHFAARKR